MNMKPILCYLLHSWRHQNYFLGGRQHLAVCQRCGAEKKWGPGPKYASFWRRVYDR